MRPHRWQAGARGSDGEVEITIIPGAPPEDLGKVTVPPEEPSAEESDDLDVRVRYSDDMGRTWSPPVRVNDDATVNSQFDPKIAIDEDR